MIPKEEATSLVILADVTEYHSIEVTKYAVTKRLCTNLLMNDGHNKP
jgi:hypothetical protein